MTNLADLLEDRDRLTNRLTVPVLMSSDHAAACVRAHEALVTAQQQLAKAKRSTSGRMSDTATVDAQQAVNEAQQAVDDAEEAAADHMVEFTVQAVGADVWELLVDAHPPTVDQITDASESGMQRPRWNPRTFPIGAVGISLAEGTALPDDERGRYLQALRAGDPLPDLPTVAQLRSSVPDVVWQQIFGAAVRVNQGGNPVPKSLIGSGRTATSS